MIEAIFFDVDGTLLDFGTHEIKDSVKQMLRALNQKGIKIFIATGRHSSRLECLEGVADFTAFITVNGQICYNEKEDIFLNPIPKEDVIELAKKMNEEDIPCCFLQKDATFVNILDERLKSVGDVMNLSDAKEQGITSSDEFQVYQLVACVSAEQEEMIKKTWESMDTTRWNPAFVDIVPKGGNKSSGIEKVLEYYHIPRENTMAFGDGHNDMEMLQYVGTGVAMGNAPEDVQAVADYVTDSIEKDGILKALQHFSVL